jgi:hypothetical protein
MDNILPLTLKLQLELNFPVPYASLYDELLHITLVPAEKVSVYWPSFIKDHVAPSSEE